MSLWVAGKDSGFPKKKKFRALKVPISDSKVKYPVLSLSSSLCKKLSLRIQLNKRSVLQGRDSTKGNRGLQNLL